MEKNQRRFVALRDDDDDDDDDDERKEEETTPSFETCTRRGALTRGTLSSANRARGRKDDDDDDAL